MKLKRAQLYLREYPRLIRHLNQLIALAPGDPNVTLIALFGSTARLEPRAISDTDLLILLHEERLFHNLSQVKTGVDLLVQAYEAPYGEWCQWGFSAVDGNAQASDLDEDFVRIVGEDGVLLYQQAGAPLPLPLAKLTPYAVWLKRVEELLARCERRLAAEAVGAPGL